MHLVIKANRSRFWVGKFQDSWDMWGSESTVESFQVILAEWSLRETIRQRNREFSWQPGRRSVSAPDSQPGQMAGRQHDGTSVQRQRGRGRGKHFTHIPCFNVPSGLWQEIQCFTEIKVSQRSPWWSRRWISCGEVPKPQSGATRTTGSESHFLSTGHL